MLSRTNEGRWNGRKEVIGRKKIVERDRVGVRVRLYHTCERVRGYARCWGESTGADGGAKRRQGGRVRAEERER